GFKLFTGCVAAIEVDVTRKQVGHGEWRAPIGDQVNAGSYCLGEQDSAQVCVRADASMGKFYALTGPLHPGNKLSKSIYREGFLADDDRRAVIDETNGSQILFHLETRFGE